MKKDRDFEKFKGALVEVKLYQPIEGRKVLEGELVGMLDGRIVIKTDNEKIMEFERDKVALVRRVVKI